MSDSRCRVDEHIAARANLWDVGGVISAKEYGPGTVALAFRRGSFGVLASTVVEVTDAVVVKGSAPVPRPSIHVPAFSSWFDPRVTNLNGASHRRDSRALHDVG
jgi:hypothetical protein